jgi:hypothetical protein
VGQGSYMIYDMQLCEYPRYVCKSRKNKEEVTFEVQEFHYGKRYELWVMHDEMHPLLCQTC